VLLDVRDYVHHNSNDSREMSNQKNHFIGDIVNQPCYNSRNDALCQTLKDREPCIV
jgi:hypothetical protein